MTKKQASRELAKAICYGNNLRIRYLLEVYFPTPPIASGRKACRARVIPEKQTSHLPALHYRQ